MSTNGGEYDVIVIGGGAAGLMAAGRAATRGRRILVLEKNRVLGKKLSITGGGRCNITNAEDDIHELLSNYGDAAKYLYSPFAQFGMKDTFDFFETRGLPIVVEARKRAFPKSQLAPDVTKVMKEYASQSGVTIRTGVKVQGIVIQHGKVTGVKTNDGTFNAKSYVFATGGAAHQETGSTGEGVEWLSELDLKTHAPNPDIVPLVVPEKWVKDLSGTTLSFMKITFTNRIKKFSETGKILFTHFGVSGPLILNSARRVKKLMAGAPVTAEIDLYPDTEIGTLRRKLLGIFEANKNKSLKNIVKLFVPHGMTDAILAHLDEELADMKVHSVTKETRYAIVDLLKAMPLSISGTMGYDWAVVSDGGIDLDEIDMKTMAAKKYPNLFFVGDVLHISRPSGGYSLQLCWTTGWIAGNNA